MAKKSKKLEKIKSMDGKTINGSSRSEAIKDKIKLTNVIVMNIYSYDYGMSIIQDF